jgi:hypothetical protein
MSAFYKIKREGPVPKDVIYQGILGESVRQLHPYTEGDPIGVFLSLVGMVSASVGNGTYVKVGNQRHPLLIWPVLAGRTSLGRKGTATGAAMELMEKVWETPNGEDGFLENNILPGAPSSGAALVKHVADMARKANWVEEDSMEESPPLLPGFPVLMIEEEWAGVMKTSRMDKDWGKNLRVAWQGATLTNIVKKPSECSEVKKSHIAIIGHVTPDEFRACLSASDVAGGSYNRLFIAYVQRCQSLPLADELPARTAEILADQIREGIEFGQKAKLIRLGADAKKYWVEEMYERLMSLSTTTHLVEAFAGRALPYVMRLAGLYAVMDLRHDINADDLKAAEALVEYMIQSIAFIMEQGRQSMDKAKKVALKGDPLNADIKIMDRIKALLIPAGDEGLSGTEILLKVRSAVPGTKTAAIQDAIAGLNGDVEQYALPQNGVSGRKPQKYKWVGQREENLELAEEAKHEAALTTPQKTLRAPVRAPQPKAVPQARPEPAKAVKPAPRAARPAPKAGGGFTF